MELHRQLHRFSFPLFYTKFCSLLYFLSFLIFLMVKLDKMLLFQWTGKHLLRFSMLQRKSCLEYLLG